MKNRKVIQVLKRLDITTLNRFIKFLNSPYFNVNKNLSFLGEFVVDYIKNNKELPEEKHLIIKYFKDQGFDDLKLRKLYSDLLQLVSEFVSIENFTQNEKLKIATEYEAIQKLGLKEIIKKTQSKIDRHIRLHKDRSSDYFYFKYLNEKTLFNLKSEYERKDKKQKEDETQILSNISIFLDDFYIIEKLKNYNNIQYWKKIKNIELPEDDINYFMKIVHKVKFQHPLIKIYYNILYIARHPEADKTYKELRKIIEENKTYIPFDEIGEIYQALISFCVNKVNLGSTEYRSELFDIYKEAVNEEGFFDDGYLTPTTFRNIVTIALRLKEFDWAEHFIWEFSNKLEEKYRSNALSYNLALLSFYRAKYDEVLSYLQDVIYKDVWYNLNSKSILLASYYELQEFEALDSLINSFKVFISREKTLSKNRKRNYLNYLKYTKTISKLSVRERVKLEKLKEEIAETRGVVSKSWLLEKIKEKLENKSARL